MTSVCGYSVHEITLKVCGPIKSYVGKDEKNLIYERS